MTLSELSFVDALARAAPMPTGLRNRARDRLVMLDIRPGEPIDDDRLATEFGFGRTPVREALKRLERDRLVVAYPRRGTFATAVDMTDFADISEIRKQLEPMAAARAARTAPAGIQGATYLARRGDRRDRDTDDPRRCCDTTCTSIARSTAPRAIRTSRRSLSALTSHATRIWCLFLDRLPDVASHVREHIGLLDAIVAGEEESAAALTLAHVTGFEQAIRALL